MTFIATTTTSVKEKLQQIFITLAGQLDTLTLSIKYSDLMRVNKN